MSSKNVLLVGNFLSGHGVNPHVCEQMAGELVGQGWGVVTTSTQLNRVARLADMLWTAWSQRDNYTVAHLDVFSGPAFLWAKYTGLLLERLGKPYILTLHGGNLPDFSAEKTAAVQHLFRQASAVTAPSQYLIEQMQDYHPDILHIPNPIPLANYPYHTRAGVSPKLVYLRAFHKIYNPTMAAQVLALLQPDYPDIHLYMVGPDKDGTLGAFEALAGELGVSDHITLPGRVPKAETPMWLGKGDIFINTTNVDNTPISVVEAMACGLCVVSTNVGGVPYLLEDGVDALLVPPEDPEAMANAIRRLLEDPQLAASISAAGRAKVEQYSWEVQLPVYERLLIEAQG